MSAENEYQPINCDDYDNLELACQHHMVLEVTLQGGDVLTGKATDLVLRKKVEYLVVTIDNRTAGASSGLYCQLQSSRTGNSGY